MVFPEFYKELEAEFLEAGTKLMGLQFLQLELRLGKTPSRNFRPVKSAEILWQFWTSYSLKEAVQAIQPSLCLDFMLIQEGVAFGLCDLPELVEVIGEMDVGKGEDGCG
ncbi:hypothetical protein Tco_0355891 [Tanacetum coccineum]